MENLIEEFILLHSNCPLPGLGSLQIQHTHATILQGEQLIYAPQQKIIFTNEEVDSHRITRFVAYKSNISKTEAETLLHDFCDQLKKLDKNKFYLGDIGYFSKDSEGNLFFEQQELPQYFMPSLTAKRVIHPNNIHAVRVGDAERTNEFMSDFLTAPKSSKHYKWWIAAAVIFMLAVSTIVVYLNTNSSNYRFGNTLSISPSEEPVTYQKAQ